MTSISILIATYNNPKYLEGCINSIIRQDVMPDEVLVAEDCPDCIESERLVKSMATERLNIVYVRHNQNKGRTNNYRYLLENATSDYVMFLDGDDELADSSFIAVAKEKISKTGAKLFSASCRKHYKEKDLYTTLVNEDKLLDCFDYFKKWITAEQTLPHSSTIFNRKESLKTNGYCVDILNTDIVSLRNLLLNGNIFLSTIIASQWNYHESNASCQVNIDEMADNIQTITIPYSNAKKERGQSLSLVIWYFRARFRYSASMLHLLFPNIRLMFLYIIKVCKYAQF